VNRYLLTHKPEKAREVFLDVLIALTPVIAWSVYLYGFRPITLILICAASVSIVDAAFSVICNRGAITDLSCAVTGVIAALLMPASVPLWVPAFTGALAGIIRNVFGGLGKNPINPAATSVLITHLAFSDLFTSIPKMFSRLGVIAFDADTYVLAPKSSLSVVLGGSVPENGLGGLFFGMRAGMLGEMSAFLLITGGAYLIFRRIIKPALPIIFLLTIGIITYFKPTLIAASDFIAIEGALHNILGSSTIICAIFMLTDPVTSPKTTKGAVIAGIVGGFVTVFVRYRYSIELSAIIGVLSANAVTFAADRLIRPMPFGGMFKKSIIKK
jgi:electron transport complex protein RnfD